MPKRPPAVSDSPSITISRAGSLRLRDGHVWVYRSDIASAEGIQPGALVSVQDEQGKFLGTALYSSSSQIAVRMLSREPVDDLATLLRERIQAAVAYRKQVVSDTDAYRVIFSEADFLPGLIVDRYNDLLSFQILTQAMDAEPVRQTVVSELTKQLSPLAVAERVDPRIRELEQLPAKQSGLIQGEKGSTIFTMNSVRFHYDALEGQKTGAFLDQRENYAAAAKYMRGEALDVFCYQGGFALHLAQHCSKITGVDSSRPALEVADQNASLNSHEIEWIEANAFDLLRDYADSKRQFDSIVLDPPAFAKSKRTLDTAMRGYKELNLRALKMLRPGGTLVTCSCSFHVSSKDFLEIVTQAARDAHRTVRILENRAQAKDHPMVLSVPETAYLKCLTCNVS
ncbi:MAG TPA: class I SAM-dependent rRNA methyltransferase [Terriglobales bacterium]|jgi:23S rRNA (cytosine1962-C5)-methyltransferase